MFFKIKQDSGEENYPCRAELVDASQVRLAWRNQRIAPNFLFLLVNSSIYIFEMDWIVFSGVGIGF